MWEEESSWSEPAIINTERVQDTDPELYIRRAEAILKQGNAIQALVEIEDAIRYADDTRKRIYKDQKLKVIRAYINRIKNNVAEENVDYYLEELQDLIRQIPIEESGLKDEIIQSECELIKRYNRKYTALNHLQTSIGDYIQDEHLMPLLDRYVALIKESNDPSLMQELKSLFKVYHIPEYYISFPYTQNHSEEKINQMIQVAQVNQADEIIEEWLDFLATYGKQHILDLKTLYDYYKRKGTVQEALIALEKEVGKRGNKVEDIIVLCQIVKGAKGENSAKKVYEAYLKLAQDKNDIPRQIQLKYRMTDGVSTRVVKDLWEALDSNTQLESDWYIQKLNSYLRQEEYVSFEELMRFIKLNHINMKFKYFVPTLLYLIKNDKLEELEKMMQKLKVHFNFNQDGLEYLAELLGQDGHYTEVIKLLFYMRNHKEQKYDRSLMTQNIMKYTSFLRSESRYIETGMQFIKEKSESSLTLIDDMMHYLFTKRRPDLCIQLGKQILELITPEFGGKRYKRKIKGYIKQAKKYLYKAEKIVVSNVIIKAENYSPSAEFVKGSLKIALLLMVVAIGSNIIVTKIQEYLYHKDDDDYYNSGYENYISGMDNVGDYPESTYLEQERENEFSQFDYISPTKVSEELLAKIVDTYVAIGRGSVNYQYSHTEIGGAFIWGEEIYQEYYVVQKDILYDGENVSWTLYERISDGQLCVLDSLSNEYVEVDTVVYCRNLIDDPQVVWLGEESWNGQNYRWYLPIGENHKEIQCYGVNSSDYTVRSFYYPGMEPVENEIYEETEPEAYIEEVETTYKDDERKAIEDALMQVCYVRHCESYQLTYLPDYIYDEELAARYYAFEYDDASDFNTIIVVDKETMEVHDFDSNYNMYFEALPISGANIVNGLKINVDNDNIEWFKGEYGADIPVVPVYVENVSDMEIDLQGLNVWGESTSTATQGIYAGIEVDYGNVTMLAPGERTIIKLTIDVVDTWRNTALHFYHIDNGIDYEYYTQADTRTSFLE